MSPAKYGQDWATTYGPLEPAAQEARDFLCPECGTDPTDPTLHRDACPRVGTCGQFGPPWVAGPWCPERDWLTNPDRFTSAEYRTHVASAHPERRP